MYTRKVHNGAMTITEVVVTDGTKPLRLTWFNNPYIEKQLHTGDQIVISGKVGMYLGHFVMNHPSWEPIDQDHLNTNRIVPVYPLSANLTQKTVRTMIFRL